MKYLSSVKGVLFAVLLSFCLPSSFALEGWLGGEAQAQSIITNCGIYGKSQSYTQTCPSGKQLYGGGCYNACPSGWLRSAVCTCYRRECSSSCWDRPTTDCGRFSSVIGRSCPGGWRRTAVCTCVQRVCNNNCSDRPVTNCASYGNFSRPVLGCPSGYENYGGRCYYACPSGYKRTAVCSCEKSGWHQESWNTVKKGAEDTIRKTGSAFANAYNQASRWTDSTTTQLKIAAEREAERLARQFVSQPDRKLRMALSNAIKVAIMTAKQQIQQHWSKLTRIVLQNPNKAEALYSLELQAKKFSAKFSRARMAERARGVMSKAALKETARSALKMTSLALLLEAGAAAGGVVAYALIECRNHLDASTYGTCFEKKAIEALHYALFDVVIAVAFAPVDLQIITPASIQLAAAVTAAVAAMTGGVGAAVTGVVIALAAKVAVTMVIMQEAEKLFPYYDNYLWKSGPAAKNTFVSLFRSIGGQANGSAWLSLLRGARGSGASASSGTSAAGAPSIYVARTSGGLLWYRHAGYRNGSTSWASGTGRKVASDDRSFTHVFASSGGVIYAVLNNGDLIWFKHLGYRNGSTSWASGSGRKVGSGWGGFRKIFATSHGVIYGVQANGNVLWYRHLGHQNGSTSWASGSGRKVGSGWGGFRKIFATSQGVIYGVQPNGGLLWYKHRGYLHGTSSWSGSRPVGNGWGGFSHVFASSHGLLYGISSSGNLHWYKHNGWTSGSRAWASGTGRRVGNGWRNIGMVFAVIEP